MFKLDEFPKLLPVLSIMFWAGAVIKQMLYYNHYDITIIQYIEFSEFITLFLESIVMFVAVILFAILVTSFGSFDNNKNNIDYNGGFFKRIPLYKYVLISIPAVSILTSTILSCIGFAKYILPIIIVYIIMFGSIIFLTELNIKLAKEKQELITGNSRAFILLSIIMVLFIYTTTYFEIETSKFKAKYWQTLIELSDNEYIESDSNRYVIGNTKNYLFYHDSRYRDNLIIPMSRVKSISFTSYYRNKNLKAKRNSEASAFRDLRKTYDSNMVEIKKDFRKLIIMNDSLRTLIRKLQPKDSLKNKTLSTTK